MCKPPFPIKSHRPSSLAYYELWIERPRALFLAKGLTRVIPLLFAFAISSLLGWLSSLWIA